MYMSAVNNSNNTECVLICVVDSNNEQFRKSVEILGDTALLTLALQGKGASD